ncbi:MAG: AAA family ATPase [Sphingobacteriales bacterium]|nr:AAA family ATPase [Sphingobacteriales bacterium]
MHPHIQLLLNCIELEEKEQANRYKLDQHHTLKQLKAEGLALHPLTVTKKTFGYADYPEITFKLSFPPETNMFRDGSAIECFLQGEEPVKGILMSLDGKNGEFRLFAPDFPEWIEEHGVGIKLAPDTRTTAIMKKVLTEIENNKSLFKVFEQIHTVIKEKISLTLSKVVSTQFRNKNLNESQQNAVNAILQNEPICIVHGPPGTGKTTTLIEAIIQMIALGEKVLVSAPSNTAVDNISKGLLQQGVKLLRVGNITKVDALIFAHTPEGKLHNSKELKEIKQLKIRAEEFRRMAHKYKRSFGKAEREQRNLLFREVKNIRSEIKKLPPTVLSNEAAVAGFNISILEKAIATSANVHLLNVQYRMREVIAGFSSHYFYNGLLQTAAHLKNTGVHLTFIDTAGSGFQETHGPDGISLQNEGELEIIQQWIEREKPDASTIAFISPYSGQVAAAKELLSSSLRISTIDSFQGQEKEIILLSLVRSNEDGDIGFLKDYRRMNVAITRAREQLVVIGDSATIGADKFYHSFLSYAEQNGTYRTVWEFEL